MGIVKLYSVSVTGATGPVGSTGDRQRGMLFVTTKKESRNMATGKKAASKAGKILKSASSSKNEKTVAASDLSQKKPSKSKIPKKK